MLFSTARVLISFSPFNSSITRSDLNLALKLLLCLDMVMNPFFRIDFSISDSLKTVRKSVLIYETIISGTKYTLELRGGRIGIADTFYKAVDMMNICNDGR